VLRRQLLCLLPGSQVVLYDALASVIGCELFAARKAVVCWLLLHMQALATVGRWCYPEWHGVRMSETAWSIERH
jgi:hypothetical protein